METEGKENKDDGSVKTVEEEKTNGEEEDSERRKT